MNAMSGRGFGRFFDSMRGSTIAEIRRRRRRMVLAHRAQFGESPWLRDLAARKLAELAELDANGRTL